MDNLDQAIERLRELDVKLPVLACERLRASLKDQDSVDLLDFMDTLFSITIELTGYYAGVNDGGPATTRQVQIVSAVQDAIDAIEEIRRGIGKEAA